MYGVRSTLWWVENEREKGEMRVYLGTEVIRVWERPLSNETGIATVVYI
jgi:hypothetical protein